MGLYLKRYDPVLALCVVLIFIPAFASMVIRPDLIFELEDHAAPAQRMDAYLKKCVGGPEYFKETRTLGISGYFKKRFLENVKLLNGYIWKAQKKNKTGRINDNPVFRIWIWGSDGAAGCFLIAGTDNDSALCIGVFIHHAHVCHV